MIKMVSLKETECLLKQLQITCKFQRSLRNYKIGAFTGAAAFNIEGYTLHATFQFNPKQESKYADYIPIFNEQLANMREKLGKLTYHLFVARFV
jgi:hypothetical protein